MPVVHSQAPVRISFVGGGSDIPSFFIQHTGAVVSTTINKWIYVRLETDVEGLTVRFSTSSARRYDSLLQIENILVRETLKYAGIESSFNLEIESDVAPGSGLGSSSALIVALLAAVYVARGESLSSRELAERACDVEIRVLRSPIGLQDQFAAAFGGFNCFYFSTGGISVEPLDVANFVREELVRWMMLFDMGDTRSSTAILRGQNERLLQGDSKVFETTKALMKLLPEFVRSLKDGDVGSIGPLLDRAWNLKRSISNVISNPRIDAIYRTALKAGACGGKVLGAGGGGHMLLFAEPRYHDHIRAELGLAQVSFAFETRGCIAHSLLGPQLSESE